MEAKNLRIGNLVKSESEKSEVFELDWDVERGRINYIGDNNYDGIPLSDDWLIDFGFQKYHAWEYRWMTGGLQLIETNGFWYPAVFSHPEMSHEDDQCVSLNRIQYVHELQNLFFAITGEELELKEVGSTCG